MERKTKRKTSRLNVAEHFGDSTLFGRQTGHRLSNSVTDDLVDGHILILLRTESIPAGRIRKGERMVYEGHIVTRCRAVLLCLDSLTCPRLLFTTRREKQLAEPLLQKAKDVVILDSYFRHPSISSQCYKTLRSIGSCLGSLASYAGNPLRLRAQASFAAAWPWTLQRSTGTRTFITYLT